MTPRLHYRVGRYSVACRISTSHEVRVTEKLEAVTCPACNDALAGQVERTLLAGLCPHCGGTDCPAGLPCSSPFNKRAP